MENKKIKNKLIKHLIIKGNKKTSEKLLLKVFKKLQKLSKKKSEKWIALTIILTTSIFKIHRMANKKRKYTKEIPFAIINKQARISLAIKLFLAETKKTSNTKNFYIQLTNILISNTNSKSLTIKLKKKLQKQALLKRRIFFYYYRWK